MTTILNALNLRTVLGRRLTLEESEANYKTLAEASDLAISELDAILQGAPVDADTLAKLDNKIAAIHTLLETDSQVLTTAQEIIAGLQSDAGLLASVTTNKANASDLEAHITNHSNPHDTTKNDVGLGNVDNTSDVNKPISNATQIALDGKVDKAGLNRGSVGLDHVDNTSDVAKPVSSATNSAILDAIAQAKAYAASLVVGLWDDRGQYDATTNVFPSTGGSGAAGAILKGDIWTVSVAGTIAGQEISINQTLRAIEDNPGQTAAKWATGLANLDMDNFVHAGVVGRTASQDAILSAINSAINTAILNEIQARNNAIGAVATGSNSGDETVDSIKNKLGISVLSGDNTGDETADTIKTKLGFTPVSNGVKVNGHALTGDVTVTANDVSLGNVDNTADANKPVSIAQAAADTTVLNTAKAYADALVVGLWDDRGNYDASGNTFPATGGSGAAGAIVKSDIWTISVPGTLGGVKIAARQTVRALVDNPGQTATNWAIGLANTDVDNSLTAGVTGRTASQDAILTAIASALASFQATTVAGVTTWTGLPCDIPLSGYGAPKGSDVVGRVLFRRSTTIAADAGSASAYCDTVASASVTLTLWKNGTTQIGTIVFAAGSHTGTITITSTVNFVAGDRLTAVGPASADATFGDWEATLLGSLT